MIDDADRERIAALAALDAAAATFVEVGLRGLDPSIAARLRTICERGQGRLALDFTPCPATVAVRLVPTDSAHASFEIFRVVADRDDPGAAHCGSSSALADRHAAAADAPAPTDPSPGRGRGRGTLIH